jgi:hypothetical protein
MVTINKSGLNGLRLASVSALVWGICLYSMNHNGWGLVFGIVLGIAFLVAYLVFPRKYVRSADRTATPSSEDGDSGSGDSGIGPDRSGK